MDEASRREDGEDNEERNGNGVKMASGTEGKDALSICVVGAGAAGLCAARHLAADPNFRFRVYEQSHCIGGTWVYNEETGLDRNGYPIHSSMYRDLRTNLPARIMNFPDYIEMMNEDPCCITHTEVLDYLKKYARHFQLVKHIEFNKRVEEVKLLPRTADTEERWLIRLKNLISKEEEELIFHGVIICNGHYFHPKLPKIQGIETFPGTVLHSHSYRKPEGFGGKTVFVLGAGPSGIDISVELADHASRVYLSHNGERYDDQSKGERLTGLTATNLIQVAGADRIQGRRISLKDGSTVEADVFLFCTGYHFSYPFLDESSGIRVEDNYITPLYKHLINIEHPTMCIVGVPMVVVPFPMFHVQVRYFLALLKGEVELPSTRQMIQESKVQTGNKRHGHKLANDQWAYNDSLADAAAFPRLPAFYRVGYQAWSAHRKRNLIDFKSAKFILRSDDNGQFIEISLAGAASSISPVPP